jgi:phosphotransferase system  glucose/maltose/N-acetylglucosamine-specific IIC component
VKTLTRPFLAALAYVGLSLALAFLWHMVIFADVYAQTRAMTRPEPLVAFGLLSMAIQGAVLAYLYSRWYRGGAPLWQGVKFGLIAEALIHSVLIFSKLGEMDINPVGTYLAHAGPFYLLQACVTGAAIGLIFGSHEDPH